MIKKRPPFYISAVTVIRTDSFMRYYIHTNAGTSQYNTYEALPDFVKQYLDTNMCYAEQVSCVTIISNGGIYNDVS